MASQPQQPQPPLNTLHYGGSLSPKTNRLGAKPQQKNTYRKQARLELMVRLENSGVGEGAAAAMLCISVPRLRTIKKSPEYLAARMQITLGIVMDTESRMAQIKEQRKEILTQMLPPALLVIANELQVTATTLAERKHKVALAQDLLDREGTFAKVSRTEVKPVDNFDFEHADAQSRSIMSAIRSVAPAPAVKPPFDSLAATTLKTVEGFTGSELAQSAFDATHTADAVEANEAFSNSHTLSQTDQEAALAKLEEEARQSGLLATMPLPTEEIQ